MFRAQFLSALILATGVWAQPYGLTERPMVGAFMDGALPSAESDPSGWAAVVAFPNLTFERPIPIVAEPGGNRLVVGEQSGMLYAFENNPAVSNKTVFLNLTPVTQGGGAGVLGIAFHPEYGIPGSTNRGYFYVFYSYSPNPTSNTTDYTPAYQRVSRFTVPDGTNAASLASEQVLINQYDRHQWHAGGGMFFGQDGFLYISVGDEGGNNDAYDQTQKINSGLFSGVLRIDVNKDPTRSHAIRRQPASGANPPGGWPPSYTSNYFIPNDNPWLAANGTILEEFYAIGLRSPHRMTYDAISDRIWLGDVGQADWEEVDVITGGGNYQWAFREGDHPGPKSKPGTVIGTEKPPVYDYVHGNGNNSVIGGYVYRGNAFPSLTGKYIFGDNGSGRVWAMTYDGINPTTVTQLCVMPSPPNSSGLAAFGLDHNNEILMTLVGDGAHIYRLATTGVVAPPPPPLLSQTGVFTDATNLVPHAGLIPYNIIAPLWSDNADKLRWMAVPSNSTITFSTNGNWSFPAGTVLVKHFDLPLNDTNPAIHKRLETRLLVHGTNDSWYGITYKWRSDNSDADLLPGSLNETNIITTATGVRTQVWYYPSRSDCHSCHTAVGGTALGPRTCLLNADFTYPQTSTTDNQLRALNHIGLFNVPLNEGGIPALPRTAHISDTNASPELRVRSYLQANCAHCHQPGGVQAFFDARFSTPLQNQGLINGSVTESLGITGARIVAPQNPAKSVLYVRDSLVGLNQMPPLARNMVDTNYINVLAEWINSLPLPALPPPSVLGLIGNTNSSGTSDGIWDNGDYINAARFVAASNLTVAFIRANVVGITGRYQCAIYSGTATLPQNLITTSAILTNPATGWQTLPLSSPVNLTLNSNYWLAIWSDSSAARVFYAGSGGTLRWGQYDFGSQPTTTWPSPITAGGSNSYNYNIYAHGGAAPAFTTTPSNRVIAEFTTLTVTNTATDADSPYQTVGYGLANPPAGATINSQGVITWMPNEAQGPSTNTLFTVANDGVVAITNSFQVIVTEVNHPPVAAPDQFARWMSQGFTTPVSVLLSNDSDPEGSPVLFDNVESPSAMGASITVSNATLFYWPVYGDTNADSFSYFISDGSGGAGTGLVSVTVMPEPPITEILGIATGSGTYTLSFTGVGNFTYTIQFTDALSPANWQNLGTATADQFGYVQFVDNTPGSGPTRFYRAVRGIVP